MGQSRLYMFLQRFASRSRKRSYHPFDRALDTNYWSAADSGGTGKSDFSAQVARNGYLKGTTGTTDDGSVSLIGPVIYATADNLSLETRVQVDAITNYNLEFGLIDAVPGSNNGGANNSDTPTTNFTNGGIIQIDVDSAGVTNQTLQLITNGNGTNQAASAIIFTGQTALVAATWITFRLETWGTNGISAFVNGQRVASLANALGGTTGLTLLAPWFYFRTRSTSTRNLRIQYFDIVHDVDA